MSPELKDLFDALDALVAELEEIKDMVREYITCRG